MLILRFRTYIRSAIFLYYLVLRYGRRPIIGICLLLTAASGFICAFFPQKELFGFWPSYLIYTLGRFILHVQQEALVLLDLS
jgi:MFS family permease